MTFIRVIDIIGINFSVKTVNTVPNLKLKKKTLKLKYLSMFNKIVLKYHRNQILNNKKLRTSLM